jgi:hypothetical protein
MKRFLWGVVGLSYSYGFYRSWTLPIWDIGCNQLPERMVASNLMGLVYISPPFCIIKYSNLALRIHQHRQGNPIKGDNWKEWGFVNPRVV